MILALLSQAYQYRSLLTLYTIRQDQGVKRSDAASLNFGIIQPGLTASKRLTAIAVHC